MRQSNIKTKTGSFGQHRYLDFDFLTTDYGFQWCPGCGNYGILTTLKEMIVKEKMDPRKIFFSSDIGQGGKAPMWLNVYGVYAIHGRALPIAEGFKVANPGMTVIAGAGDGGAYAEGTNHLVHASRRNLDITFYVQDNGTYALTHGQASPTTMEGVKTVSTPFGNDDPPLNPLQLALASGAAFVARAFVGDQEHFQQIMTAAINHHGFALVDVLQPCVVWNHVQTWQSWRERVYRLDPKKHDPTDKTAAFKLAENSWEKIPTGIFYQDKKRPTFIDKFSKKIKLPLVNRNLKEIDIEPLMREIKEKSGK